MIGYKSFVSEIKEAISEAQTSLPDYVVSMIEESKKEETGVAEKQLDNILKNIEIAEEEKKPICQDTGVPIFYIKMGDEVRLDFSLEEALKEATTEATEQIPLRPSIVSPLERENTGDNSGNNVPIINYEYERGNKLEIIYFPKGAGSENMCKQKMFNPGDKGKLVEWIVDVVKKAGPKPCPPIFLGIGVGGSFDYSAKLSKKAIVEKSVDKDEKIVGSEDRILERVNSLNIGPMGLGGKKTALDVSIRTAYCHTASLPVSVSFQCWANRKAKKVFKD